MGGNGGDVDSSRGFSSLGGQKNWRERQLVLLETADGNGHQWKNPLRFKGCVPSENKFRCGRPPLRCAFPTGPYMNYARGWKICQYS